MSRKTRRSRKGIQDKEEQADEKEGVLRGGSEEARPDQQVGEGFWVDDKEVEEDLALYLEAIDDVNTLDVRDRLGLRFKELGLETTYLLRVWPGWFYKLQMQYLDHMKDLELAELASYYPHDTRTSKAN